MRLLSTLLCLTVVIPSVLSLMLSPFASLLSSGNLTRFVANLSLLSSTDEE